MLKNRVHFSSAAFAACAIVMSFAFATPTLANDLFVSKTMDPACSKNNKGPAPTYTEIQQAVTAAKQGDNIWVCPGTYQQQVVITKALQIVFFSTQAVEPTAPQLASLQPTTTPAMATNLATGAPMQPMMWVHDVQMGGLQIVGFTVDGSMAPSCSAPCQTVGILDQNSQNLQTSYMNVRNISYTPSAPTGSTGGSTGGTFGASDGFGVFVQGCGKNVSPALPGCPTAKGSMYPNGTQTQIQIQNYSVSNYKTGGIVVNEAGTQAQVMWSSTQGLGQSATVTQTGMQFGFGAMAQVQNNVSSHHLGGPGPYCQGSTSSANYVIFEPPSNINVELQNNISEVAELGFAASAEQSQIQNNVITDSACNGVYLVGDQNQIQNNLISHTDPTNPDSTAIYVIAGFSAPFPNTPGSGNHIHGNTINEATYGVAAAAATTNTQEDGDIIVNVTYPLAGTFQHSHPHYPHDPSPAMFR